MTTEHEHLEATQGEKVTRKYGDRQKAEQAVERLRAAGFDEDVITMQVHGGRDGEDGTFVPGFIEVVVFADDRADEAERILTTG